MAQKKRIEYIDCIKGFCILWVVTIHLGENLPDWIMVPYRMPLFFFMSGIFFSYLIDTMLALFQIIRKGKDYL